MTANDVTLDIVLACPLSSLDSGVIKRQWKKLAAIRDLLAVLFNLLHDILQWLLSDFKYFTPSIYALAVGGMMTRWTCSAK